MDEPIEPTIVPGDGLIAFGPPVASYALTPEGGLVPWLRAQLDEDEHWAVLAGGPAASWTAAREDERVDVDARMPGSTVPGRSRTEVRDVDTGAVVAYVRGNPVTHMALHDPASVLADIAAKRAILDLADRVSGDAADMLAQDSSEALTLTATADRLRRLVGSAYRHRAGYHPAWTPR